MLVLMLLVISAVSQCQAWGYSIFVIHFDCPPHTDFTLLEQISAAHELQQKPDGAVHHGVLAVTEGETLL